MWLTLLGLAALALLIDFLDYLGLLRRRDSLAGQVVLVTGAAGGLGRELARAFASEQAVLVLWDVRAVALKQLRDWLENEHGVPPSSIHTACVDVSDASTVASAAADVQQRVGVVRVLVNNAAIVRGEGIIGGSGGSLERSLLVNAAAHFHTTRAFLPAMLDGPSPRGTVVTIGSVMGALPAARLADYCASKAAVGQLSECLRWELRCESRRHAVRTLLVTPYKIETPLFEGGMVLRHPLLRKLLPALEPIPTAQAVVLAVRTRREWLTLPWVIKFVPPLLSLMPPALRDLALEIGGARVGMAGFRGRSELFQSSF